MVQSWKASLSAEDLAGFAWRLVLDTHSNAYLAEHEAQVPGWVRAIVEANSSAGLRALVEQTHTEEPGDRYHPSVMAARSRAAGAVEAGLVIAGTDDIMAPARRQPHARRGGRLAVPRGGGRRARRAHRAGRRVAARSDGVLGRPNARHLNVIIRLQVEARYG